MWRNIDQATKDRLEAKYQINKEKVAESKAAYVDQYGKIEKKKKKKHAKKEWSWLFVSIAFIDSFLFSTNFCMTCWQLYLQKKIVFVAFEILVGILDVQINSKYKNYKIIQQNK